MIIDCRLKFWFKAKGEPDNRYYEMPIYEAKHYTNDFDTKWELQIVSIDSDGDDWETLKKVEIKPEKGGTHYISFNSIGYAYSTELNIIYCTTTRLTI